MSAISASQFLSKLSSIECGRNVNETLCKAVEKETKELISHSSCFDEAILKLSSLARISTKKIN